MYSASSCFLVKLKSVLLSVSDFFAVMCFKIVFIFMFVARSFFLTTCIERLHKYNNKNELNSFLNIEVQNVSNDYLVIPAEDFVWFCIDGNIVLSIAMAAAVILTDVIKTGMVYNFNLYAMQLTSVRDGA